MLERNNNLPKKAQPKQVHQRKSPRIPKSHNLRKNLPHQKRRRMSTTMRSMMRKKKRQLEQNKKKQNYTSKARILVKWIIPLIQWLLQFKVKL